ncbi:GerMN domain-containing protein [Bacillus sp. V3B]|uniref:GerMN domain-containing protein n=1 Tax=Bacillus sp. V3B TaxID=2804915 RepID=UPI002108D441|nr:GerMN domain-containing protein [Bacillus sp. V3B]MCQ6273839.1 GerMN domain-containing protein [Bacillus sp. V3B]
MKKPEWTDKQLEDGLKQLPKIQDDRDPRDIYQNVLLKLKNRRSNQWLISFAVIASVFILFLVVSSNMNNGIDREEKATENEGESMEMTLKEESPSSNGINEKQNETNIQMNDENNSLMDIGPMESTKSSAYFFFYPTKEQSAPFLIPIDQKYTSVSAALDAMKKDQTKDLKASIPEEIQVESIDGSNKTLIIYLSDHSQVENNQSMVYTIEAILFTAKEFDFHTVQFENTPILEVGKFRLDHRIKVPSAENKQIMDP